ncbi:MAG: cellulase family glycosylhydrolase [Polyangiaceae bacterium]|nr:cellulase family glycosylhydrolase [Polyangiaceae bacterium]
MSAIAKRLGERIWRGAFVLGLAVVSCEETADDGTTDPFEDPTLEPLETTSRHVTVSGDRLLDEAGREVLLRGYCAGNRAKMPPFLPMELVDGQTVAEGADTFFSKLAALGANTVRLTFSWEAFEPTRGERDAAYLAQYSAMLDAADAHGIGVIVDFHQDVFASPFCGDGFPLWAIGEEIPHGEPHYDCGYPNWSLPGLDAESDVSAAYDRLWQNTDGLQDAMEEMWRAVARELAGHPAVVGFEVINEPGAGSIPRETFEAETLPAFIERMGSAIREEAGDVAVFNGGRFGDAVGNENELARPELPGFVFSPHYYNPVISLGLNSIDAPAIEEGLGHALAPAAQWGVPVLLGEFGTHNDITVKAEYLDLVLDILDLHHAHATLWDASIGTQLWNSEDFSVFTSQGDEQPWASSVVRPYPRAVSGRVERFEWNAESRRFEIHVVEAGDAVSEIYLPVRHLGTSPSVTVQGARYRFLSDRELLLVRAEAGAAYSVVVTR